MHQLQPVTRRGVRHRTPSGFTILELLTVIGILTVLVSIILPALGAVRESARRVQCTNQLKQVGLALHLYHEGHRCLPVGWQWEPQGQSAYGWAVSILPFLDQAGLHGQIDRQTVLSDPRHQQALATSLPLLRCPSDLIQPRFDIYPDPALDVGTAPLVTLPAASYLGVFGTSEPDESIPAPLGEGVFLESRPVCFSEFQRGLTNTVIVGERTMEWFPATWLGTDARAEDAACLLAGNMWTAPNCQSCDECEFGSRHAQGANFLYGDGSVKLLSEQIDRNLYQQLSLRKQVP